MSSRSIFSRKLNSKLIASSFLIAGIVGIIPRAIAADFVFDGSVADGCVFDAASYDGVLTENGTKLEATPLSTTISCNKIGKTLTITAPTPSSSNPATADSLKATAELTGANIASLDTDGTTSAPLTTLGDTTVEVGMEAEFGPTYPVVPAGDYVYTVTVTVTP